VARNFERRFGSRQTRCVKPKLYLEQFAPRSYFEARAETMFLFRMLIRFDAVDLVEYIHAGCRAK